MDAYPFGRLLLTCLLTATAFAADNPFVGQWKLNASKTNFSDPTDQMKIQSAGENKYVFDLGGGTETILIDGTEQPGNSGTTLSVTAEGPRTWKVIRKANGRTLIDARWTLSKDGKRLTDNYTQFNADGSPINIKYLYVKKAAGSGFAGVWTSIRGTLNTVYLMRVEPWQGDGLLFIDSLTGVTRNVRFDGKDYPNQGANAGPGATTSIRRLNERTLELTDKLNGTIVDTRRITLSSDLKKLTMKVYTTAGGEPKLRIFDRQ